MTEVFYLSAIRYILESVLSREALFNNRSSRLLS